MWVLWAYSIIFLLAVVGTIPKINELAARTLGGAENLKSWTETVENIAHIVTYTFAAITIVTLLVIVFCRRLMDPFSKEPRMDDAADPLDRTRVTMELPKTPASVEELVNLGDEAFAAWGSTTEERALIYQKFIDANSKVFRNIRQTKSAVAQGFSCILPIKEDAFCKFRLGSLDSWDFSGADICATATVTPDYICLNAIYLRASLVRQEKSTAVRVLCAHLAEFLRLADGSMARPILIAEGLTLEGRRFLARYGFKSCYQSKSNCPIYELDLSRPNILNERAKVFEKCLKVAVKAQPLSS